MPNLSDRAPAHDPEISANLKAHTFFHGSQDAEDVQRIFREGFRSEFLDDDGRWFRDGNLGVGVYLSCDWRTALWFGNLLLQTTVIRGTKLVDTSVPPDTRVLEYLSREFGRDILHAADPRKVLPENKHLTLEESIAVLRHHYHETWHTKRAASHPEEWPDTRVKHSKAVSTLSRRLLRHGFHGFGHPGDDNGIVIFQAERVKVERVLLDVPPEEHFDLIHPVRLAAATLPDLQRRYPAVNWSKASLSHSP